jgi:hypothetical protein
MQMRDILKDRWAYDRAIAEERQNLEAMRLHQKRTRKANNKLKHLAKNAGFKSLGKHIAEKQDHYDKSLDFIIVGTEIKLNTLLQCHPFLIGSATLDSLLNEAPKSYDYIRHHQLPFERVWYEFYEPISLRIPFSTEKQVFGMTFFLNRTPGEEIYPYEMNLYYENNGYLEVLQVRGDPTAMTKFEGATGDTTFRIDMAEKQVKYATMTDIKRNPEKFKHGFTSYNTMPINDLENQEIFTQLANLAVNLINYINAHNVTVVRRERRLEVPEGKGDTKDKSHPFYLVKLKEGSVQESDEPYGLTWNLQWRVYVRGHDRRYRTDEGEIYKVLWIEPYVKGPENAPWRYQRYEALARKLEIEKQILNLEQRKG